MAVNENSQISVTSLSAPKPLHAAIGFRKNEEFESEFSYSRLQSGS